MPTCCTGKQAKATRELTNFTLIVGSEIVSPHGARAPSGAWVSQLSRLYDLQTINAIYNCKGNAVTADIG